MFPLFKLQTENIAEEDIFHKALKESIMTVVIDRQLDTNGGKLFYRTYSGIQNSAE